MMKNTIKRRQFIQTSLLATAGTMLTSPSMLFSKAVPFQPKNIAGDRSIGPYLMMDDLLRLTQISELDLSVRMALSKNQEHFQLGRAWTISNEELIKLFKGLSATWKTDQDNPVEHAKFALCCGLIAHQVFDKWLGVDGYDATQDLPEKVIYQDTYVIKMMQNADIQRKIVPIDKQLEGADPESVAELLHLIQQRNLIRMHTMKPEFSDVETWLDQFLAYYHKLDEDNIAYAKVYCKPDPTKVDAHIRKPDFYAASDLIIDAARKLQMSRASEIASMDKIKNSKPASHYGKALQDALNRMTACANFIVGNGSEEQLKKAIAV